MEKLIVSDKESCQRTALTIRLEWFSGPRTPVRVSDTGWDNLPPKKFDALLLGTMGSADGLRINLLVNMKQEAVQLTLSSVITASFDGETLILQQEKNGRTRVVEIKKRQIVE